MATWPSGNKTTTANVDSSRDSISSTRTDIEKLINNQNDIIDIFNIPASPTDNYILKYNAATSQFDVEADLGGWDGTTDLVISDGVSIYTPDSTAGITFYTSGSTFGAGVDYIQLGNTEMGGTLMPAGASGTIGSTSGRFDLYVGDININGTQTGGNSTVGKHDIWIPAQAMYPTADGGCSPITTVEISEGYPELRVLDFSTSTTEYAQFSIAMPKSWNEGTITFTAYWTGASAALTGGVSWALQGVARSDDDGIALSPPFGTAQVVDDTYIAQNELHITPESSALTIGGTPQEGDLTFFQLYRDTADSNDTYGASARLIGIKIHYTTDAETDA